MCLGELTLLFFQRKMNSKILLVLLLSSVGAFGQGENTTDSSESRNGKGKY